MFPVDVEGNDISLGQEVEPRRSGEEEDGKSTGVVYSYSHQIKESVSRCHGHGEATRQQHHADPTPWSNVHRLAAKEMDPQNTPREIAKCFRK